MLKCMGEVEIPEGKLNDNQIAKLMADFKARGDSCAARLGDVEKWLRDRNAVLETTSSN